MKDFAAEYRASVEVDKFLSEARLMLDMQETSMEAIISTMLQSVLDKEEDQHQEAMQAMFTHDGGKQHPINRTLLYMYTVDL